MNDWLAGIATRVMEDPADELALLEHSSLLRGEADAYARVWPVEREAPDG